MVRSIMCSVAMLGICLAFLSAGNEQALGQDKTDKTDKKAKVAKEAKITKLDAKMKTVTVKMKGTDKDKDIDVEKTFKLAEDIEYMDSTGRVASALIFTSGDEVLIIEDEGTISKMKMKDKTPTKAPAPNSK